jgi:hypothetical protein
VAPAPAQYYPHPPRRREKIFCDKWIHEGTCAFTQMGCKYRHEMPMDRDTQQSLGLNHGLPNWYRRAYNVNVQPPAPAAAALAGPPLPPSNRLDGPWRRLEAAQAEEGYVPEDDSMQDPANHTRKLICNHIIDCFADNFLSYHARWLRSDCSSSWSSSDLLQ